LKNDITNKLGPQKPVVCLAGIKMWITTVLTCWGEHQRNPSQRLS